MKNEKEEENVKAPFPSSISPCPSIQALSRTQGLLFQRADSSRGIQTPTTWVNTLLTTQEVHQETTNDTSYQERRKRIKEVIQAVGLKEVNSAEAGRRGERGVNAGSEESLIRMQNEESSKYTSYRSLMLNWTIQSGVQVSRTVCYIQTLGVLRTTHWPNADLHRLRWR